MELKSSFQYRNFKELPPHGWMEQVSAQIATADLVFRSGLSWIFNLGIQPDLPFYLKNNLSLINQLSFISLLLALPGSFLLMLAGFQHTLSLLVCGTLLSCLILGLNGSRQVQWAQAIFAFSPAATLLSYALIEMASGNLTDPLLYVLVHQGLSLSLLLPVLLFGFEKSQKWMTLAECVVILLVFDVASGRAGNPFMTAGTARGFFSILSVLQFAGLAFCVVTMQSSSLKHEQQVDKSTQKLHSLAIRDGMTGIFNRTFMEQMITDGINRSKRSKTPLSLLMIDVDNFKHINDTQGHHGGDEALMHLSKLLEGSKRSTDYLGRWGGDELVLLLTDTNLQGGKLFAEKLRTRVSSYSFPNKNQLTISLGVSLYQEGEDAATFIERADAAMYRAKRGGRNRVETQE